MRAAHLVLVRGSAQQKASSTFSATPLPQLPKVRLTFHVKALDSPPPHHRRFSCTATDQRFDWIALQFVPTAETVATFGEQRLTAIPDPRLPKTISVCYSTKVLQRDDELLPWKLL